MGALELIVLIGVAVLAGETAARRLHLPGSLVLLAIGGGLSFVPRLYSVQLTPNVVLFVFLPALVYWESLPAALAHVSGVVAVATCGIVLNQGGPRIIPAAARRQVFGFWQVASFVLNDAPFVLTGLHLHRIATGLGPGSWPLVLGLSGIVIAVVVGLRLLWFYAVPYVLRAIDRRPSQRALRAPARRRLPGAWAGMRGSISLALALALPSSTNAGGPLPHREVLIAVTFAVVVFTIVVQGLSMPAVLRWSSLRPDPTQEYEEALASRTGLQRALALLPGIAAALGVPDVVRDRLAAEYRAAADEVTNTMDDTTLTVTAIPTAEANWERMLRRAVIPVKREAALGLRRTGRIDDIVYRRIQARLDTEEIRLADVFDEEA